MILLLQNFNFEEFEQTVQSQNEFDKDVQKNIYDLYHHLLSSLLEFHHDDYIEKSLIYIKLRESLSSYHQEQHACFSRMIEISNDIRDLEKEIATEKNKAIRDELKEELKETKELCEQLKEDLSQIKVENFFNELKICFNEEFDDHVTVVFNKQDFEKNVISSFEYNGKICYLCPSDLTPSNDSIYTHSKTFIELINYVDTVINGDSEYQRNVLLPKLKSKIASRLRYSVIAGVERLFANNIDSFDFEITKKSMNESQNYRNALYRNIDFAPQVKECLNIYDNEELQTYLNKLSYETYLELWELSKSLLKARKPTRNKDITNNIAYENTNINQCLS